MHFKNFVDHIFFVLELGSTPALFTSTDLDLQKEAIVNEFENQVAYLQEDKSTKEIHGEDVF